RQGSTQHVWQGGRRTEERGAHPQHTASHQVLGQRAPALPTPRRRKDRLIWSPLRIVSDETRPSALAAFGVWGPYRGPQTPNAGLSFVTDDSRGEVSGGGAGARRQAGGGG